MSANQKRFVRLTEQRCPKISCGVVVNLDARNFLNLLPQKFSRFRPCRRERDALRAIFISGQRAELFEFSNGSFRIERHEARC